MPPRYAETGLFFLPADHRDVPPFGRQVPVVAIVVRHGHRKAIGGPFARGPVPQQAQGVLVEEPCDVAPGDDDDDAADAASEQRVKGLFAFFVALSKRVTTAATPAIYVRLNGVYDVFNSVSYLDGLRSRRQPRACRPFSFWSPQFSARRSTLPPA